MVENIIMIKKIEFDLCRTSKKYEITKKLKLILFLI